MYTNRVPSLSLTTQSFRSHNRYDPAYGARPLKRAIQREVETILAKLIISGEVASGDTIVADVQNERLVIAAHGTSADSTQMPAASGVEE